MFGNFKCFYFSLKSGKKIKTMFYKFQERMMTMLLSKPSRALMMETAKSMAISKFSPINIEIKNELLINMTNGHGSIGPRD